MYRHQSGAGGDDAHHRDAPTTVPRHCTMRGNLIQLHNEGSAQQSLLLQGCAPILVEGMHVGVMEWEFPHRYLSCCGIVVGNVENDGERGIPVPHSCG